MLQLGAGAMRQTECARLLFQLVTLELWRLWDTLKTINTKNYENTVNMCCFFVCFFYLFAFKTVQVLRVIMYLIALSKAKKAGGENLAIDPERKLSQHHPRKRWVRADQSWQLYSILGLAGWKCLSNTSHDATGRRHPTAVQPLPNSYKQWMNAKYNNLCELYLVCSAQTISSISSLHRRWGLIKKTSDSYQHLHLCSLWLCRRGHWSHLGS